MNVASGHRSCETLLPQDEPAHKPGQQTEELVDQVDETTTLFQRLQDRTSQVAQGAAESPEMSMETGRVVTWRREDSGSRRRISKVSA